MLGAGGSRQLDTIHTSGTQGIGSGSQRRTRGDDVVDHQHRKTVPRPPGPKCGTGETLGTGLAGLGRAMGTVQQPTARYAELASDSAGDRLGLVVAASTNPAGAGGRPGDEIDVCELQPAHHVSGQHAGSRSPMAELERDYQLPRCALEREGGTDAIRAGRRVNRGEREAAAVAQHIPGATACGTTSGEQHGAISTRGV